MAIILLIMAVMATGSQGQLCPQPPICEPVPFCDKCNQCCFNVDGSKSCTEIHCADAETDSGFDALYDNGCWLRSPTGGKCIFYSPCPVANPPTNCKESPNGFCSECNMCGCRQWPVVDDVFESVAFSNAIFDFLGPATPTCHKVIPNCKAYLRDKIKKCCYSYIDGKCRLVYPCPEEDNTCKNQIDGHRSCKRCRKCECMHEKKFCDEETCCPDPIKEGCYVYSTYAGVTLCHFVSPCPGGNTPIEEIRDCFLNPDRTTVCNGACAGCDCYTFLFDRDNCAVPGCRHPSYDFCYICSEERDVCEFVSPCPLPRCKTSDVTCEGWNLFKCDEQGIISGPSDPTPMPDPGYGCWGIINGKCVFHFPCSFGTIQDPRPDCRLIVNVGEEYCYLCNKCICGVDGLPVDCTSKTCPKSRPTIDDNPTGHWEPVIQDGVEPFCKFVYP